MNNNKQLALVYFFVVLIWSTTPIAINWSAIGAGAWFALMARMLIGLLFCLVIVLVFTKRQLSINKNAIIHYLVASVGIWLTMTFAYLGAIHINSGFISVIFGFSPLFTGLFAVIILKQKSFTSYKLTGMFIAFIGLVFIYQQSIIQGKLVFYGLVLIFLAMLVQSLISVLLKKLDTQVSALETTTGALFFAMIPLIAFWIIFANADIPSIDNKTLLAILYLGFFGSVAGFIGYYHIIKHLDVNKVGLLPLMTPIFALIIGFIFNNETLSYYEFIGIILIIIGLFIYQFLKSPLKTSD